MPLDISPKRKLGLSDLHFTTVGLGTWKMEADSRSAAVAALRKGIEEGANHIDTAELYGDGRVEEIVSEAIKGLRNNIYIVSKVLPINADFKGTLKACENSLKRLKTDHLDVYLLHWRESETKIEETFRAFEKLKEAGKILHWGVSNFSVADMEEAAKLVGKNKIVCNQVLYHMQERSIEFDVIPWCKSNDVTIVAYSPFGQGAIPRNLVLDRIAKDLNATPAQVILAFLTRDPAVISIPKSANIQRTVENVRAMNLNLSEKQIQDLDKAFPARHRKYLPTI